LKLMGKNIVDLLVGWLVGWLVGVLVIGGDDVLCTHLFPCVYVIVLIV
jgi:hypothetical protein